MRLAQLLIVLLVLYGQHATQRKQVLLFRIESMVLDRKLFTSKNLHSCRNTFLQNLNVSALCDVIQQHFVSLAIDNGFTKNWVSPSNSCF